VEWVDFLQEQDLIPLVQSVLVVVLQAHPDLEESLDSLVVQIRIMNNLHQDLKTCSCKKNSLLPPTKFSFGNSPFLTTIYNVVSGFEIKWK
jgi:hypothetical protein